MRFKPTTTVPKTDDFVLFQPPVEKPAPAEEFRVHDPMAHIRYRNERLAKEEWERMRRINRDTVAFLAEAPIDKTTPMPADTKSAEYAARTLGGQPIYDPHVLEMVLDLVPELGLCHQEIRANSTTASRDLLPKIEHE